MHTFGLRSLAAASLLLVSAFSGTAVAVTPVASSFRVYAEARTGTGETSDSDRQDSIMEQGGTIAPLAVNAHAFADYGGTTVEVFSSGAAVWDGPSQGSISLTKLGWQTNNVVPGDAVVDLERNWAYEFVATESGVFALDYEISIRQETTKAHGLTGFTFVWSEIPADSTILAAPSAGTLTREIVAGETYTAVIGNRANLHGGLGTRTAFMDGEFRFHIGAVPEPNNLVLTALAASIAFAASRNNPMMRRMRSST